MPIIRCVLNNKHTAEQLYASLARQLHFPAHFGNTLDALWDTLISDVEGPIEIVWETPSLMGPEAEAFLALFSDAARERDDLTVRIR